MGSPHLVPSSCFWRSVLTDLVHPALVCRPLLPPQGVLAILLPEHWATEKKRFVRSRNSLREKKGNAECWLLGKGGASAAVVENAWEAPLTIALCYGLACVHTTKDQRSLKGSGYLHAVQHLAWVSSELPAEPHRPQVNNYCTGDVFLSLKFSKWWKDWVADCQHDVFQQGVKAFWVLQHSMEDSGHEVSWDGWRTVQGTVWSSSCQAFLSVQPEKKPCSHVEVSPWEKPVGLLQSRDRRELICMPRRQPVSRARGEHRQPNWLCRQKVLSYPHHDLPQEDVKHRTNNAIFPDHHLQDQQRVPSLVTVTAISLEVTLACTSSATMNSSSFVRWGQPSCLCSAIFKGQCD